MITLNSLSIIIFYLMVLGVIAFVDCVILPVLDIDERQTTNDDFQLIRLKDLK
jgi:hypothetical protein